MLKWPWKLRTVFITGLHIWNLSPVRKIDRVNNAEKTEEKNRLNIWTHLGSRGTIVRVQASFFFCVFVTASESPWKMREERSSSFFNSHVPVLTIYCETTETPNLATATVPSEICNDHNLFHRKVFVKPSNV